MSEEYIQNYLGQFWYSKERLAVILYAELYHKLTEDYDQTVCCFVNEYGIAIPTNGHELALVNKNAKSVMEDLWLKHVHKLGGTKSEWEKTIRDVAHHFNRKYKQDLEN